jgi:hypothetical protein
MKAELMNGPEDGAIVSVPADCHKIVPTEADDTFPKGQKSPVYLIGSGQDEFYKPVRFWFSHYE